MLYGLPTLVAANHLPPVCARYVAEPTQPTLKDSILHPRGTFPLPPRTMRAGDRNNITSLLHTRRYLLNLKAWRFGGCQQPSLSKYEDVCLVGMYTVCSPVHS